MRESVDGLGDALPYLSDEEVDEIVDLPDEYEEGREVGPDHFGKH